MRESTHSHPVLSRYAMKNFFEREVIILPSILPLLWLRVALAMLHEGELSLASLKLTSVSVSDFEIVGAEVPL